MIAPMEWLKQYVDINVSPEKYMEDMIRIGDAVEGIDYAGEDLKNVVVGRILSIEKHPDADKLVVCQIDVGGKTAQIVTGASNVREGDLVPVILDGGLLPGGKEIRTTEFRGVRSEGMLGSGPEMGVDDSLYPNVGEEGILIFQEEYPLGMDVREIFGLDDYIVDFDILANRPDCQCILGLARESAVALGADFRQPDAQYEGIDGKASDSVEITVEDTDLCARYIGAVIKNVRIAPSPGWMRKRLTNAGMRPINNIVDITNYVMIETGHPMHAFDLSMVRDNKIIVRRAKPGETVRTLDGKDRALTGNMLTISDGQGVTGLAGVMGGEESEITEKTKDILFECAKFDRTSIRLTSRALGMRTEASGRFEKGVSASTADYAMRRACQLVEMLDAGDVVREWTDIYPVPEADVEIVSSASAISRLAGLDIPAQKMAEILDGLSIPTKVDGDTLTSIAPAWRQDISQWADIAEEVLRVYGYDNIPFTLMQNLEKPGRRTEGMRNDYRLRDILCGFGLDEAYHFSFMSEKSLASLRLPEGDARLRAIPVKNPLTPDHALMRTSLVPAMLSTLSLNMARSIDQASFFEIGRSFMADALPLATLPDEQPWLCLGAYGEDMDFYGLRAIVDGLLDAYGITAKIEPGADPYYHPGRCATLRADDKALLRMGEIHPEVMAAFSLQKRVYIAEIDIRLLRALKKPVGKAVIPSRFPSVSRDLAIVVRESVAAGQAQEIIRANAGDILENVRLFDVYRGGQVGENKKSLAFSITLRAQDHTLSEEEISGTFERILSALNEETGAVIR